MYRKSLDNVTAVIVAFEGFKNRALGQKNTEHSGDTRKQSSRSRGLMREGSFNEGLGERGSSSSRRINSANVVKPSVRSSVQPHTKRPVGISQKGERDHRTDASSRNYSRTFLHNDGGKAALRGLVLGRDASGSGAAERRQKQDLN